MDYCRFKIGDWVKASTTADVGYNDDGVRQVIKNDRRAEGVIVGLKRMLLGKYHPAGYIYPTCGEPDDNPACLDVTGNVVMWEIRTGLLNRPVYALDEDVAAMPATEKPLPILYQKRYARSDAEPDLNPLPF